MKHESKITNKKVKETENKKKRKKKNNLEWVKAFFSVTEIGGELAIDLICGQSETVKGRQIHFKRPFFFPLCFAEPPKFDSR